jgi:hypothetical protein
MEQCSTQELIRSTRAFDERVRYWKNKGLTPEQAEFRARKKNELSENLVLPMLSPKRRSHNFFKPRAVGSLADSRRKEAEPTQAQIKEVLSKLFESGQATLLNSSGQVIEPTEFKREVTVTNTKRSDSEQIRMVLVLFLPALQVLTSSSLLIAATVKALGGWSLENFSIAMLLETGVLSLFLTQSKCIWKKLAMRCGAIGLVLLGFFLLHTTANADQYRRITQAVSSADDVSSIKKTKDKLDKDLEGLPATHRTARNELLSQIEAWDNKLAAAKATNAQGSGVEALQQIFMSLTLMRLALQLLNVFFGHSLLERLKKEGFLT